MAGSAISGFRYACLADDLEDKIREGIYRSGEKMPSLRKLHTQTGLSIPTVYQAYIELEKRGVVIRQQKNQATESIRCWAGLCHARWHKSGGRQPKKSP